MTDSESSGWEAATWEGSRHAQLRRSLRLTVRQRLQALGDLAETSRRLAELTRPPQGRSRRPEDDPSRE